MRKGSVLGQWGNNNYHFFSSFGLYYWHSPKLLLKLGSCYWVLLELLMLMPTWVSFHVIMKLSSSIETIFCYNLYNIIVFLLHTWG